MKIISLITNKIKALFLAFVNHCRRCPECGSWFSMQDGSSWIGGYNNLCKQATSRTGERCYECGHMEWKQTDKEYTDSLPEWCEAYCG